MEASPNPARGWLKIRPRCVTGSAHVTERASVYCPAQGKTLTLEECAACEHCSGCVIGSTPADWLLRCERAAQAPEGAG
jgi:putative hemolysin